jgi:hypothetical protein
VTPEDAQAIVEVLEDIRGWVAGIWVACLILIFATIFDRK